MSPRLHLAVDNCFASKRWTEPLEWMQIAADADLFCVEASADNECDPLYTPPDALQSWLGKVEEASLKTGVRVVNLYSGHGSYATLGLAHNDERVRDHMQQRWLVPMIDSAARLGAGLGFFCHAFPQSVLLDPALYAEREADLYRRLAELADYAAGVNVQVSVEQMYSPHQIPWTIAGGKKLLRAVWAQKDAPLYLTLDTGHMVGQSRYLQPDADTIMGFLETLMSDGDRADHAEPWLGSTEVSQMAHKFIAQLMPAGMVYREIQEAIDKLPHMFASREDGDLYAWTRHLGAYSPIVHLQQTDGTASAHRPFTAKNNATGIVHPTKVFEALRAAYSAPAEANLPPRVTDIYLTIEVFSGTAERPIDSLRSIRETAKYWRQYLPEDGMTLDEALLVGVNAAG
jgi:sugar phosphate isomerase/epimerase